MTARPSDRDVSQAALPGPVEAPPPPPEQSPYRHFGSLSPKTPVNDLRPLDVLFASKRDLETYQDANGLGTRTDHQFLTSLPKQAARVLGARLLSDNRDTGRLRRLLWDPSSLVRGAALTNPRLPWAARKAYTALSAADREHYGQATAWDLSQLVRNPGLLPGELKNLAALMYSDDQNFWPALDDAKADALSGGDAFGEAVRLWPDRLAMRSDVLYRATKHQNCPPELLDWYINARPPDQLGSPAIQDLARKLMFTNAANRRLLARYHASLHEYTPELDRQVSREQLRELLLRGRPSRDEVHALFAFADLDMVIETLAGSRGHASELTQAKLVRRISLEAPERLPHAWIHLTGPMVAAALASLPLAEAKVEASLRPELPARFRQQLDRWAMLNRDNPAALEVTAYLTGMTYDDQLRPSPPVAVRPVPPDRPGRSLYQDLMRQAQQGAGSLPDTGAQDVPKSRSRKSPGSERRPTARGRSRPAAGRPPRHPPDAATGSGPDTSPGNSGQ